MNGTNEYSICLLQAELSRRMRQNPRYSIRSYSRALALSPGSISQILSGKRVPSFRIADQISSRLSLSPAERERFLSSIANQKYTLNLKRVSPKLRSLVQTQPLPTPDTIDQDTFEIISDWHHYAILDLSEVLRLGPDSGRIIAKVLGITPLEAKLSVERLLRVGLLKQKEGTLRKSAKDLSTKDKDFTGPALKKYQKQIMEKAMESLFNDPIDIRSMTSMSMAIDPKKLPKAKQMIDDFSKKLTAYLESGKPTRVYQLGIQLFPIQKEQK